VSFVKRLTLALGLAISLAAGLAQGHVGSPDVFFQGKAGPYSLLVAIRPPDVIPGVARIEVRVLGGEVSKLELTPTPMTGEGAKHPPVADLAERSVSDPRYFEGALWLMRYGSWEVRIHATGAAGEGELRVPVPALALKTQPMQEGMTYFLIGMMIFLTVGMVAIVGASMREAKTEPGTQVRGWSRRTLFGMGVTAAIMFGLLWFGKSWWADDARSYTRNLYKPLTLESRPDQGHLEVQLKDPGWMEMRKLDDLIPDHGHLMHLFLIRWPAQDYVFHLHPEQHATGFFGTQLPAMPAGTYRLYGDIVHESGLAETAVGTVDLPGITGTPLTGDDAGGPTPTATDSFDLPNGYRMILRQPGPVKVREVTAFSFAILDPKGQPAPLEPYMGMGGHAEFVKEDGAVFAHVHPTGSVPMASVAVASPEAMMAMHQAEVGPVVTFPYGVPTPGRYRIFVQMRRAGHVETGAFGLTVTP